MLSVFCVSLSSEWPYPRLPRTLVTPPNIGVNISVKLEFSRLQCGQFPLLLLLHLVYLLSLADSWALVMCQDHKWAPPPLLQQGHNLYFLLIENLSYNCQKQVQSATNMKIVTSLTNEVPVWRVSHTVFCFESVVRCSQNIFPVLLMLLTLIRVHAQLSDIWKYGHFALFKNLFHSSLLLHCIEFVLFSTRMSKYHYTMDGWMIG